MTEEFHYDADRNMIPWPAPITPTESIEQPLESEKKTTDCNDVELQNWDNIVATKWLPVKGWTDIKKWDRYKNISLTDNPTHVKVSCKKNGTLFLKTEYFKKI